MFFWTLWKQLSQSRQKFSTRGPNFFAQYLKLPKQVYFFHKEKVFHENYGIESQNAVLSTPLKIFRQMAKNLLLKVRKRQKTTEEFPQKPSLLKVFKWTRKMQFSKIRWLFSIEFRKSSAEGPITTKVYIFPKKKAFSVKMFLWTRRMQFLTNPLKIAWRSSIFFRSFSEMLKKMKFWNIFFRRKKSYEHVGGNCNKTTKNVPDKLLKLFRWKSETD